MGASCGTQSKKPTKTTPQGIDSNEILNFEVTLSNFKGTSISAVF